MWERVQVNDSSKKEIFVTYAVVNAIKIKRKISIGCKRNNNKMILGTKKKNGEQY